jgi:hypothetical protein
MATVSREATPVTGDWPDWADDRIELGVSPSAEDEQWWSLHCPSNRGDHDDFIDEYAAAEAAAMDAIERGLLPPDLGPNPLRGIADEIARDYADEAERISGTRPSDEEARQAMDIFWFKLATGR